MNRMLLAIGLAVMSAPCLYAQNTFEFRDEANSIRANIDLGSNAVFRSSVTGGVFNGGCFAAGTTTVTCVSEKLKLMRSGGAMSAILETYNDTPASFPMLHFRRARGTATSPSVVEPPAWLGVMRFSGWTGAGYGIGAEISAIATDNFTTGYSPTQMNLLTSGYGGLNTRITIAPNGRVQVNPSGTPEHQFSVYGPMLSTGTVYATNTSTYSIQASSGIRVSSGGVTFPDGTIQYTAAAAGSSVFASTITVGNSSVYSTTISYAAVVKGAWFVVASTFTGGAVKIDFTSVDSSYTHRLTWNLGACTGVTFQPQLNINYDSANNYFKDVLALRSDNATLNTASESNAYAALYPDGNSNDDIPVGYSGEGVATISSNVTDRKQTYVMSQFSGACYASANLRHSAGVSGSRYMGSAKMTSMTLYSASGSGGMCGIVTIEALWNPSVQ